MSDQEHKKAKITLVSSLLLGLVALVYAFLLLPRDHGGYPALIIGATALVLFARSRRSLRKAKPVTQVLSNTPAPVATPPGPDKQRVFVSDTSPVKPRVALLRSAAGILTASLGGYLVYLLVILATKDLASVFAASFVAAVIGFIALWRINKDPALQAIVTSVLTIWFMYNLLPPGLHDQVTVYALTTVVVTVAYVFNRFILGIVNRRYGLTFIVVAILIGLAYMYVGMGVRTQRAGTERKQLLQELDFQYYKPSYAPDGYRIEEPYASAGSFVDQPYVHVTLANPRTQAVFIYQFKQLDAYKPPVDCGPDTTIHLSANRPPKPCKEIGQSKIGCTVYREITYRPTGLSNSQPRLILYNAYCTLNGTTIVISEYDYELSNEEILRIFDSMKLAGGRKISGTTPARHSQEKPDIKDFITAPPVLIKEVKSVSRFRSCVEPYQNAADEPNRSLSHHFGLNGEFPRVIVDVFAPFDSLVEDVKYDEDWNGVQIRLASSDSPWRLEIRMSSSDQARADLRAGSVFKAGAYLGFADEDDGLELTLVKEENGVKHYDSIFAHFNQSILNEYAERGVTENNVVISKAERDANPCPSSKIPDRVTPAP